ncbi:MAG: flavin reductase [Clostridia bacterium]|nr:flavin reductase [Clostridia bacterium]
MKEKIKVSEYARQIMEGLRKGALLNTKGDKFNSMVIGWGHLGVIWGQDTFVVYVRQSRYTKAQLDKTGEFSVSFPLGDASPEITRICGMQSGRDIDKVKEARLTLEDAEVIKTPAVKEYPLTLECEVMYARTQDISRLPDDMRDAIYPQNVDGSAPLANRDPHSAYIGRIVDAYIIK